MASDALKLLPPWPCLPTKTPGRGIVVGEVHHPVKPVEISNPSWLIIPERGLYTGVAIFGAVGSGQDLGLHAPVRGANLVLAGRQSSAPAAGLILEVKANFCHDIRESWPMRA